ncbi:DinB family protein [Paenibacillus glycinis]|uniref:DUF664 domain-containing protein n=1 Tax=Paenibacillus glycinis TaxID=2697035 RepID=A0ABW9XKU7_9BACL|nr:DinB family protein [Paenibacillus glycinis]NBD23228.1 DUF664 domain-containing protein [Paenibacillus glycinis]
MSKTELLLRGWDYAYGQEDWYPPLSDALNGLTAEQAHWRPEGGHVNTVRETVQHLIFYKERLLKRLTGEERAYPEGVTNDDTFAVPAASQADWNDALDRLRAIHAGIRAQLAGWTEEDFERKLPTTTFGNWAHSLAMHDAYHTGQIIMVRKLQGSWPERRSFD